VTDADALPVLTPEEMRDWDRRAIEESGVPERVLMEAAGRAAARLAATLFPEGRVVAAVGRGNNGGDALVVLRCLRAWGREVLALPAGPNALASELAHGWEIPSVPTERADAAFAGAALLVDGLLGTGARGAPREPEAALVAALNRAGPPVLALDGPTGVDLGDGSVAGEAVRAAVTVTFGAPKRGLLLFPGRGHAGRLLVVETAFPPLAPDRYDAALITPGWAAARVPARAPDAHKGTAGTVALLAGSAEMAGAALLAAHGALRAGVGKARVVCVAAARSAVNAAVPEALFVDRDGEGVHDALEASDAVVAGPGMGTDERALELLRWLLDRHDRALLLDADALTLLARHPDLLPDDGRERLLLTPHPGEMSRLLGRPTRELAADPFGAAAAAVERFRCAVLVKGSPSLVAAPGATTLVNVAGHSGIATGGMGDTLAGAAGALLAAGAAPRDAGATALYLSGRAAEIAGRGRGLLPRDVAEALPAALLEEHRAFGTLRDPDVLLDLPAAR
jgi:NAD(P)H-hydrate epimerase